ncbi:MAG: RNA-binding protein [Pseudomonadota bacterium]
MASSPDGRAPTKPGPERTCIATGEAGAPDAMIRFVRGPDGSAVPDLAGKLPGRGAWVGANRAALERAAARKAFSRAFKAETSASGDLVEAVEAGLADRVLNGLGLARRAGAAVLGFEQVREALRKGGLSAVFEAADGAEDGRSKVLGLAFRAREPILVIGCFDSAALGLALGRGRVVHAAVHVGAAARGVARDARRLAGFRALVPESWRGSGLPLS